MQKNYELNGAIGPPLCTDVCSWSSSN